MRAGFDSALRAFGAVLTLASAAPSSAREGGSASPPRVLDTVPRNGAVGVSPGNVTIRVTFDRPVRRGGYSITGLPGTAPLKVAGQPRLSSDGRVFELLARVAPDKRYGFSVNNARFHNFRGLDDVPVAPHSVMFVTGS